jgi:hypothetical protein
MLGDRLPVARMIVFVSEKDDLPGHRIKIMTSSAWWSTASRGAGVALSPKDVPVLLKFGHL